MMEMVTTQRKPRIYRSQYRIHIYSDSIQMKLLAGHAFLGEALSASHLRTTILRRNKSVTSWFLSQNTWPFISQWLFLVPVKGGIGGIFDPPIWQEKCHLYTTYSPCLLGGYIIPTTFYRNLKKQLNKGSYNSIYRFIGAPPCS